jgi:hypothetical protein
MPAPSAVSTPKTRQRDGLISALNRKAEVLAMSAARTF